MNKQSLHFLKQLVYLACILLTLTSCEKNASTPVSDTIDYSNPQCWFENKQDAMGKNVDLFYVVPTCVWDYRLVRTNPAPHGYLQCRATCLGESFHPIG